MKLGLGLGMKSTAIALLGALSVGIPVATGLLGVEELGKLSAASCLVLGALTSVAVGLVSLGGSLSRSEEARAAGARELPSWLLHLLLAASFFCIAAVALGNHGVVRLRELGAGSPPAGRCKDAATLAAEAAEAAAEPEPPPLPQVDQAGCALVRRAYQLGYAKSLGTCAPQKAAPVAPRPVKLTPVAPCLRRHLDEPFLHYAWRRWTEAAEWAGQVQPVAGSRRQVAEVRTKLGYFGALTASSGHALSAVPHAAHHLWIALPDPQPAGFVGGLLGHRDCESRYVDVPLWPRLAAGQEAQLVQHALGQLLFSSRFGTTTACANYRLHWGAAPSACDRLLADPEAFLREQGGWDDVAGVLDRRRRQLELRQLAATLGRHVPPEPPAAAAVVSLSCLRVDGSAARAEVTGRAATIAGQALGVRQLRLPRITTDGDGPIELLAQLARLLAGAPPASARDAAALAELLPPVIDEVAAPAAPAESTAPVVPTAPTAPTAPTVAAAPSLPLTAEQQAQLLDGPGFTLTRLEAIEGSDPFAGERWPLRRPELLDIYPFQRVLFDFIDGFRRSYLAQRGRL